MALSSAGAKTDTMEVVWCVRVFYHLSLPLTYMQFPKSAIDKKICRTLPTLCENRAQSWSLDEPWRTIIRVLTDDRCQNQSDSTLHMVQRSLGTFPGSIFSAPWSDEREVQDNFWSVSLKIIKKHSLKLFHWPIKQLWHARYLLQNDQYSAISVELIIQPFLHFFHWGSVGKFNSCMARQ